jgi:hypothetical protein
MISSDVNKFEFLQLLVSKRQQLNQKISVTSSSQMTSKADTHSWSLKDGLAHLTHYEGFMFNNVYRSVTQDIPAKFLSHEEQTSTNARVYEVNKHKPLVEVLTDMHASFQKVVALVESLPEDVLCDEDRIDWLNGQPLWKYMLDETSGEHYQEHLGELMTGVDHFRAM